MRDRSNLTDREVAIATRAQPEFERRCELRARLDKDGYCYERLHLRCLEEAGIIEIRKESYGTFSVRRGAAWEEFYSEFGLQDTREGLQQLEIGEMIDRSLGPIIDAALNPNVLPFRRSLQRAYPKRNEPVPPALGDKE